MKILKISLIVIASLAVLSGAGHLYASSGIKTKPGYAKLVMPRSDSVNTVLSVNIGSSGLGPVQWLFEKITHASGLQHEVPKQVLTSVLNELQGVQLRIYEVRNNHAAFDVAISESIAALRQKNWQPLITVREEENVIAVMQYGENEQITGLSIMASTPDNALFLNLIGPFDAQAIAATVKQIN